MGGEGKGYGYNAKVRLVLHHQLVGLDSTVLLEALSYGLPTIALDHCGFTNVITDECGIKISIRGKRQVIKDIAKAIDEIATDDERRKRMSIAAIVVHWRNGWEEKANKIDRIYKKVLE